MSLCPSVSKPSCCFSSILCLSEILYCDRTKLYMGGGKQFAQSATSSTVNISLSVEDITLPLNIQHLKTFILRKGFYTSSLCISWPTMKLLWPYVAHSHSVLTQTNTYKSKLGNNCTADLNWWEHTSTNTSLLCALLILELHRQ